MKGDIICKKTFNLGKIDYNESGRKNCLVEIRLELKEAHNSYMNIDYPELSICGGIWNPCQTNYYTCGQCLDTIKKYLPTNKVFNKLYDLWKNYHLNGMRAGDKEQEAEIKKWLEDEHYDYDYDLVCEHLEAYNLLVHNGYRYGTAWLVELIPDDVITEIKELCNSNTINSVAQ